MLVASAQLYSGLYLGREFDHNDREVMYNTGGPGYILNKVSLQVCKKMDCAL